VTRQAGVTVRPVEVRSRDARRRVLVIDDAEDNRNIYAFFLGYDGFEVEVAGDGEAGLGLAQDGRFDVIVMDLTMPRMDGWETTRRLKADPRTQTVPIIILTGYPAARGEHDAVAAGSASYLTKPCLPETLASEIRRVLAQETVEMGGPEMTPHPE
jgi:two-component system cell cycle response regulator DivK